MSETCPCNGERSANWHPYNGLPVCQASKDRKNAQIRARTAARRPKKKPEVQEDCVCKGEKGISWHRYHKVKPCLAARKERRSDETSVQRVTINGKATKIRWTPGSSILVPEIDPL